MSKNSGKGNEEKRPADWGMQELDKAAKYQASLRREARTLDLLTKAEILTEGELTDAWYWLWQHKAHVDRNGRIRLQLMPYMNRRDVKAIIVENPTFKYVPYPLEKRMRKMMEDPQYAVENDEIDLEDDDEGGEED